MNGKAKLPLVADDIIVYAHKMQNNLQIHNQKGDGYKNKIQKSECVVLKTPWILCKRHHLVI